MVVISTADTPESVHRGRPKMATKNLILLTPDFFTVNMEKNIQFEDVDVHNQEPRRKDEKSLYLVPPTSEGPSSLSPTAHCFKSADLENSIAVVPFLQSADQSSRQLLPFRQNFSPFRNASSNQSSYLSICQSDIPLGIFWDVENVRLPKNKSPGAVIEAIRRKFLVHYKEAEFIVVCDAFKERKSLLLDFNNAQVTVVHVPCTSKNAADDKLRQCMRRFIDNTGSPCAVMLISSDVNFSVDLSDFKNRKKIPIILLHGPLASEALILSSNEHYLFDEIVDLVPATLQNKVINKNSVYLEVTNLPPNAPEMTIRQRLEQIAENCGGKVSEVHKNRAIVRFTSSNAAERALLRMNGEDVFGRKIVVQKLNTSDRVANSDAQHKRSNFPPPPNPAKVAPPTLLAFPKASSFGLTKTLNTAPVNEVTYHRPFYRPNEDSQRERVLSHLTSESSDHNLSDDASPHLSSDYDEDNERPEKQSKTLETKENCDDFNLNRSRVKHLMLNIPHKSLPFNVFLELFKLSFNRSITLSELKRMVDLLLVTEDGRGPFLLFRKANSEKINNLNSQAQFNEVLPRPRCELHDEPAHHRNEDQELLFVNSALNPLNLNIIQVLKSHGGSVPLGSLAKCYAAQFGVLQVDEENGVPFEQLLACMKNVSIVSEDHHKLVKLTSTTAAINPKLSWNPLLVTQLNILSNEIVDLLKTAPSNRIPFNGFNAAYYDHFARHCKVSDYGYHRLVDLFEAMPHVVLVLGEGTHRYLTLSHQILINRFKSDVVKILKHQPNKRVSISKLEDTFEKTLGKALKPPNYGLCKVEDLLSCLIESKAIVLDDQKEVIGIPEKELTQEQMAKVKQFAIETVKLLKGAPKYSMPFSTFIPAYHVNFGKQCRLSLLGCSKLVELFERISDVVEVIGIENSTEKIVRLNLKLRFDTLGNQLVDLIKKRHDQLSVLIDTLPDVFRSNFGFFIDPRSFECHDIYDLLDKLQDYVQVVRSALGDEIRLSSRLMAPIEKMRVLKMLCGTMNGSMSLKDLLQAYKATHSDDCQLDFNKSDLFTVEENYTVVKLSPIFELGRQLLVLINEKGGKITLNELEKQFSERFGVEIAPSQYGHESVSSLLTHLSRMVAIKGKGAKKGVVPSQFALDLYKLVIVGGDKKSEDFCSKDIGGLLTDDVSSVKRTTSAPLAKPRSSRIAAIFPL